MANIPFLNNAYFSAKVGIGTDSPDAKLSISDILGISGTGNNTYGQVDLVNTQTGASGDEIGPFITFRGKRGGVDSVTAAYGAIGGVNTGTTGNSTGAITFLTKNVMGAAQDLVEQMRISTGGNVGIGTTSPDTLLDVSSANFGTTAPTIRITNTLNVGDWSGVTSDLGRFEFFTDDSSGNGPYTLGYIGIKNDRITGTPTLPSGAMVFATTTYNASGGAVERMRIDSSGNVGIGTTSPSTKLYVDGGESTFNRGNSAGTIATFRGQNAIKAVIGTATSYFTGNVGIGTTSPDTNLEVESASGGVLRLTSSDTTVLTGESIGKIEFKSNDASTSGNNVMGFIDSVATNVGTRYALSFGTGDAAAAVERMRIDNLGAVRFNDYGAGTLVSDASGNITAEGGAWDGPYLPLAGGTMTGNTDHNDNVYSKYGTADQLRIWNNGLNSYIFNYTSGNINIGNDAVDKDVIFYADRGDGSEDVFFRLDGSETNGTTVLGVTLFPDKSQARFGNQGDLRIYHDGSNSYIQDTGTGSLYVGTNSFRLTNTAGTENLISAFANDTVILYNNNIEKLRTTGPGVNVTGDIQIDSALLSNQNNTDVDTGTETVANVAIATYTAAFFDFVVKKTTNVRSGTVYACHDGTNVEFTETSTNDLGDTSDVTLSVDISGTNMRLLATVTSDDWSVKSLIRAI